MSNVLKTKVTDNDVIDFINQFVEDTQKKTDSLKLLELMKEWTGYEPKIWGSSIIGFGNYHYKSERSKQEGDWFYVGFSPRKAAFSLYVLAYNEDQELFLKNLGKFKQGKGCIYIKKLSDINVDELKNLVLNTLNYFKTKYIS
ncbi:MAG: DUF1801 domain-containing protein [Candidatus Kapaibacteriota bacterium]